MKKLYYLLIMALCACVMLSSCGKTASFSEETEEAGSDTASGDDASVSIAPGDIFSDRDSEIPSQDGAVFISLKDDSALSSSEAVSIADGAVTLKEEATYVFSGSLNEGKIIVNAPDTAKINIVLDGAQINNSTSAPLYILSCDKVFVTLTEGSENTLENTGTFINTDENNVDGAVFSKQDLTFNGSGSLTVNSSSAHGIVCKDDLVFTGGKYTVSSAGHALESNDSVRIKDAAFTLASGKDGIHCENDENTEKGFVYIGSGSFDISAEGDGISAGLTCEITGGEFSVLTGGGSENAQQTVSENRGDFGGRQDMAGGKGNKGGFFREEIPSGEMNFSGNMRNPGDMTIPEDMSMPEDMIMPEDMSMPGDMSIPEAASSASSDSDDSTSLKGIKAAGNISISGGTFNIDSADDSIHSDSSVSISGGVYNIESGDDGIHAEEKLTVTGGTIDIKESYEGLEALQLDISGGEISLDATDDGLNAAGGMDLSGMGGFRGGDRFAGFSGGAVSGNGSILISGGRLDITAFGDGIDSNGTLEISGGLIAVTGPDTGDTATLDYDFSGVISGGSFLGTGASGMAQSFSEASQGVITVRTDRISAGSSLKLTSSDSKVIIEAVPSLDFSMVIISSPDIIKGEEYTLTSGSYSQKVKAE